MFWINLIRNSQLRMTTQLIVVLIALFPFYANSEGCQDLDPNSEPYSDDGTLVHCRCKQGYAKWQGHCRLVEEVRTRLEERLKNAQAGGRAALYAWSQQSLNGLETRAAELVKSLDKLCLAKGAEFGKQTVKFEVKLTEFLSKMGDCSFSDPDLKTSCQNIKNFQRLVKETQIELDKLSPKKESERKRS